MKCERWELMKFRHRQRSTIYEIMLLKELVVQQAPSARYSTRQVHGLSKFQIKFSQHFEYF